MIDEKIEAKIKSQEGLKLGQRKVFQSRYTSLVSLPRTFVENCLGPDRVVEMILLKDSSLKITAVTNKNNSKGD